MNIMDSLYNKIYDCPQCGTKFLEYDYEAKAETEAKNKYEFKFKEMKNKYEEEISRLREEVVKLRTATDWELNKYSEIENNEYKEKWKNISEK